MEWSDLKSNCSLVKTRLRTWRKDPMEQVTEFIELDVGSKDECDTAGSAIISNQLSRNEYRALVDQAPIMIWRATTTAECDYFNDRWLEFRGRRLDQEYGNRWTEGVHPEDLKRCLVIYLDAFEQRRPFEM
jgi:PAS domain-containing protein